MDPLRRPSAHSDGWFVERSALLTTCYDDTNGFLLSFSLHEPKLTISVREMELGGTGKINFVPYFGGVLSLSFLLYYLLEFICFNCTCFSYFFWCSRVGLFFDFLFIIFCAAWLLFSSQPHMPLLLPSCHSLWDLSSFI